MPARKRSYRQTRPTASATSRKRKKTSYTHESLGPYFGSLPEEICTKIFSMIKVGDGISNLLCTCRGICEIGGSAYGWLQRFRFHFSISEDIRIEGSEKKEEVVSDYGKARTLMSVRYLPNLKPKDKKMLAKWAIVPVMRRYLFHEHYEGEEKITKKIEGKHQKYLFDFFGYCYEAGRPQFRDFMKYVASYSDLLYNNDGTICCIITGGKYSDRIFLPHKAARIGCLEVLQHLSNHFKFDLVRWRSSGYGWSALNYALLAEQWHVVDWLMKKGASINYKGILDILHRAASTIKPRAIEFMLCNATPPLLQKQIYKLACIELYKGLDETALVLLKHCTGDTLRSKISSSIPRNTATYTAVKHGKIASARHLFSRGLFSFENPVVIAHALINGYQGDKRNYMKLATLLIPSYLIPSEVLDPVENVPFIYLIDNVKLFCYSVGFIKDMSDTYVRNEENLIKTTLFHYAISNFIYHSGNHKEKDLLHIFNSLLDAPNAKNAINTHNVAGMRPTHYLLRVTLKLGGTTKYLQLFADHGAAIDGFSVHAFLETFLKTLNEKDQVEIMKTSGNLRYVETVKMNRSQQYTDKIYDIFLPTWKWLLRNIGEKEFLDAFVFGYNTIVELWKNIEFSSATERYFKRVGIDPSITVMVEKLRNGGKISSEK